MLKSAHVKSLITLLIFHSKTRFKKKDSTYSYISYAQLDK